MRDIACGQTTVSFAMSLGSRHRAILRLNSFNATRYGVTHKFLCHISFKNPSLTSRLAWRRVGAY